MPLVADPLLDITLPARSCSGVRSVLSGSPPTGPQPERTLRGPDPRTAEWSRYVHHRVTSV